MAEDVVDFVVELDFVEEDEDLLDEVDFVEVVVLVEEVDLVEDVVLMDEIVLVVDVTLEDELELRLDEVDLTEEDDGLAEAELDLLVVVVVVVVDARIVLPGLAEEEAEMPTPLPKAAVL